MFDFFDTSKLLIIGAVALMVIPPKDLPGVLRQLGQAVGKLRRMAAEFQSQFNEALKDAEMDTIKKDLQAMTDSVNVPLDIGTSHSIAGASAVAAPVISDLPDHVAAPHPVVDAAPALADAGIQQPEIAIRQKKPRSSASLKKTTDKNGAVSPEKPGNSKSSGTLARASRKVTAPAGMATEAERPHEKTATASTRAAAVKKEPGKHV